MLLVEFFFFPVTRHFGFSAKLLQKINALGHWDSKGKEECGGEDKYTDKGTGRRKTSGDIPSLALKSQQHGAAQ